MVTLCHDRQMKPPRRLLSDRGGSEGRFGRDPLQPTYDTILEVCLCPLAKSSIV